MRASNFPKPVYGFLGLVWAVSVACQDFPHPGCQSHDNISRDDTLGNIFLYCGQANLDIPDDFNVRLLPAAIATLEISCPSENYCNILRENFEPIPWNGNMSEVILRHFRAGNESQRPPIDRFLEKNKRNIQKLAITSSKLHYLDKEFMRGFRSLIELRLSNCSLRSLELDTFEEIVPSDYVFTRLSYVYLESNQIDELDWSVFLPVRSNLRLLNLSNQKNGLHLSRSGTSFSMHALRQLGLKRNGLKTIPNEVLQTLFLSTLGGYWHEFGDNNFCSDSDCSCCHLKNFMEWANSLKPTETNKDSTIRFDCGDRAYQKVSFTLDIYQNCTD